MSRWASLTRAAVCLSVICLLISGPSAWAQGGGTVYSCQCSAAPTLNGVLAAGEWNSTCGYRLELHGVAQNVTSGDAWYLEYPPAQSMQLYVMRDSANLYLGFQWTHTWNNDTATGDSSPDKYVLVLAFDFVRDGVWQDVDNNANTIDDGLGLVYLGFDIGDPNPPQDAWIKIYIPHGQYVISWDGQANEGEGQIAAIGGPPEEDFPGTIYHGVPGDPSDMNGNSVTFTYGVGRSPGGDADGQEYTYTIETVVAQVLFHSPAGFGFGLGQETDGQVYWWTWPSTIDQSFDANDETGASLLGILTDLSGSLGALDPLNDPQPLDGRAGPPVGGAIAPADKLALVLPWLSITLLVGIVSILVLVRRRRP